jgi:hypothetical protein
MWRTFVATTEYFHPVFFSNAVSFLTCRPDGLTRRTYVVRALATAFVDDFGQHLAIKRAANVHEF